MRQRIYTVLRSYERDVRRYLLEICNEKCEKKKINVIVPN